MKHATPQDMHGFENILSRIRGIHELKERTPLHFYYKGKGIIHFHVDSGTIYADVGTSRIMIGSSENPDSNAEELLYATILREIHALQRKS
jgi:hypothetical protein